MPTTSGQCHTDTGWPVRIGAVDVTLKRVIDDFAKAYLHEDLRWVRASLRLKLEGAAGSHD